MRLAHVLVTALTATLLTVPLLAASSAAAAAAGPAARPAAPRIAHEANSVGQTPAMGWSSWSFLRSHPSAATIEAQALAMHNSGLAAVGYDYINVDDFWYDCPGSQGPDVDSNGRWVTDASKFPPDGSENGIQVVANYVHSLGLNFGLYVTPGISDQAVAKNTPIAGTSDTADEIADGASENNYNCHGMQGINYSKPGAQAFINSWADEFASWGVDYIKLDGVGTGDVGDVEAWSAALQQSGRPIHLELSNNLAIGSAATWAKYANGWRTGGDIECYSCESGSSYPLTDWSNVDSRFSQVAAWQPYGGPGGFNDYDSIEVGNGSNDGLTTTQRQTQLSLWALASSPLILGTDLTNLDSTDLSYLKNTAVIAVDQDGIDASRIASSSTKQVFSKKEPNGDAVVGLFNTSGSTETISTTESALGLATGSATLDNLWASTVATTTGSISASVPSDGVVLYRVIPDTGVSSPYKTYSSATDGPAQYHQSGSQFSVTGAGKDLWTDADAYSTLYSPGALAATGTVETEVTAQEGMTGYAKAGIIVRNSMTGSGTTPEGVILYESPSGGIQLEWDSNSGDFINTVTPANGTIADHLPVWLKLTRSSTSYTGSYSLNGTTWTTVGTATVPGQAATQDAGMFVTSHAAGSPGQVSFSGFTVTG